MAVIDAVAVTMAVAVIDVAITITIAIVTVTAIMIAIGADGKSEKLSVKALGKVAEYVVSVVTIITNAMVE